MMRHGNPFRSFTLAQKRCLRKTVKTDQKDLKIIVLKPLILKINLLNYLAN